jgi:hypothetical protein
VKETEIVSQKDTGKNNQVDCSRYFLRMQFFFFFFGCEITIFNLPEK